MKSVLSTLALATALPFTLAGCVVVDSQGHITREEKRFTVTGLPGRGGAPPAAQTITAKRAK